MTRGPAWLPGAGGSGRLALLFAAVVAPPALALVWLGWQFVQHDRSLLRQREDERRQIDATTIVQSLAQSLAQAEARLTDGGVPDGMVRFVLTPRSMSVEPADRLLWHADPPPLSPIESALFADAERLELRDNQPDQARAQYERWSRSSDASVRAGALIRLARVHRRQKSTDRALAAYRQLAAITTIEFESMPVDLLARRQICDVLEDTGQSSPLAREADALARDFVAGHWLLDRDTWDLVASDIRGWTGRDLPVSPDRAAFSELAAVLSERSRMAVNRTVSTGRTLLTVEGTTFTVITRASGESASILAVAPSTVQEWVNRAAEATPAIAGIRLVNDSGESMAASVPADEGGVTTRLVDVSLPWPIVLGPPTRSDYAAELAFRQRMLLFGLAAILLLLAGGSYVLWRVMQREIAMSRLQKEFVAAVSHEFRTPLTSVKHLTDLLVEHEMPREKRQDFYTAIGRSANRLQRLVESLLDFSRMDSGRQPYDLRVVNLTALIGELVEEFTTDLDAARVRVDFQHGDDTILVHADRTALAHAIRNLLDNAVKYSTQPATIKLSIRREAEHVAISVTDTGIGVPKHERGDIFRRFVRGEEAVRRGIQGTGLGLALVSHIVAAHHGRIELESEEGRGSTFTVVVPALRDTQLAELDDEEAPIVSAAFKES